VLAAVDRAPFDGELLAARFRSAFVLALRCWTHESCKRRAVIARTVGQNSKMTRSTQDRTLPNGKLESQI